MKQLTNVLLLLIIVALVASSYIFFLHNEPIKGLAAAVAAVLSGVFAWLQVKDLTT